jgi:hypothetical protein
MPTGLSGAASCGAHDLAALEMHPADRGGRGVGDPRSRDDDTRRGSPLLGAVLLALLPPAFLGVAYFLFVEYKFGGALGADPALRLYVRLGGAVLVAISLALAAACGYLVAERFLRPLRLLLRLAESGEVQPGRADTLRERGREFFDLHRLLRVLVNQNKAGARAMEELEQLRVALARFREEISRTGLHGIQPEVTVTGPLREVAVHVQAKRSHLLSFFRDLRERVGRVREEMERLAPVLGIEDGAGDTETGARAMAETPAATGSRVATNTQLAMDKLVATTGVGAAVERLRRLGTVLALESARAGGSPAARAAEMLERFHAALGDLEATLDGSSPAVSNPGNGRAEWVRLPPAADRAQVRERWRLVLDGIQSIERRLEEVEER